MICHFIPTIVPSPPLCLHPRGEASICLLESPPCPDALCDLLLSQLRGDDDGSDGSAASAWARLAALVYHYQPPRWERSEGGMMMSKRWGTLGEPPPKSDYPKTVWGYWGGIRHQRPLIL